MKKKTTTKKPPVKRQPETGDGYTAELGEEICNRLMTRSAHQVFADKDMPDKATFYRWLSKYPDLCDKYARARKIRAACRAEQLDEIMSDLHNKKIDANQARVMLDAIKWQTAKEDPRTYGDKQVVDHTSSDGTMSPLTPDQRALLDKAIDGAY